MDPRYVWFLNLIRQLFYLVHLDVKVTVAQVIKPSTRHYQPNYGYEPYWPGGQWVLYGDPKAPTTPKPVMVGPDECPDMYRDIKHVCCRRVNEATVKSVCVYPPCYGSEDDAYNTYKTFDTYCSFLDAEYKSKESNRWIYVHLGHCETDATKYFKNMKTSNDVYERAKTYMKDLNKVFAQAGPRTTWPCTMC